MKRVLYVGDMHVVPEEIEDAQNLIDFVFTLVEDEKIPVCLLGDQHHTHSIIRVEVVKFWIDVFRKFKEAQIPIVALVGNHDLSNSHHPKEHAMLPYKDLIHVVDEPTIVKEISEQILFLPYFVSNQDFIDHCRKHAYISTVVCHQTFNGSQYDNGFYAKDGIDPRSIPQSQIISGHIHTASSYDKVLYVGSPRWRTFNDSNVEKHVLLIEHDENGGISSIQKYDTSNVCKKIVQLTENEFVKNWQDRAETFSNKKIQIILEGTKDEVLRKKAEYKKYPCSIKTIIKEDNKSLRIKESDGIKIAFKKYFDQFKNKIETSDSELAALIQKRLFQDFHNE